MIIDAIGENENYKIKKDPDIIKLHRIEFIRKNKEQEGYTYHFCGIIQEYFNAISDKIKTYHFVDRTEFMRLKEIGIKEI